MKILRDAFLLFMVVTSAYLSYHSLRISLNQSGQEFLFKLLRLLCVKINSF